MAASAFAQGGWLHWHDKQLGLAKSKEEEGEKKGMAVLEKRRTVLSPQSV